MTERGLSQAKYVDFPSRPGGRFAEAQMFRPQMDTFSSFLSGRGRSEDKRITMTVNYLNGRESKREEVWHRHEPGFIDGEVRILKIGAHPDDTGLDSGAAYLAVKEGIVDGVKKTRFGVITATAGQKGEKRYDSDAPIGKIRVNEDAEGSRLLGADFVANLGFMDGEVAKDQNELETRLTHYLSELRPHAIILADPEDPAHEDHIAVTRAVQNVLRKLNQKPMVVYNEYQNGNKVLTPDHVAYKLTHREYKAVQDAFFVHTSQTDTMTRDIENLMDRPYRNADLLGFDLPVGVFRQDQEFSQEPFGKLLGNRVIPIPQAADELGLLKERIKRIGSERVPKNPTVIFEADIDDKVPDEPLQYGLALTNTRLIAPSVVDSIKELDQPYNVSVTHIKPENADNLAYFEDQDVPSHAIAKCLIVKVNGNQKYAAILVPADTRADLNGTVPRHLGVRQVSLAPSIYVEEATGMQSGSISPFGLPEDWEVLADSRLAEQIQIMVGSGKRASKLVVRGTTLLDLPNITVLDGLGMSLN